MAYFEKRLQISLAIVLIAAILLFAAGCERKPLCDAVFYGDSITEGGNFDELFPELKIVNCGIGGATIEYLTEHVENVSANRPAKIFVMAGANNLDYRNIDTCVELYRGLLDALLKACPYAEIYVESMLPLDKQLAYHWECTNPTIRSFNQRIAALAEEYGLTYIDIYPAYELAGGLDPQYSEDGAHLKSDAFGPWAELVRPYLE